MHTLTRNTRAIAWIAIIFTAVTALYLARPLGSNAKSASELQNSIAAKRAKESRLSGDISRMSGKIQGLRGRIRTLQNKQNGIQADLDRKEARQAAIETDLISTRRKHAAAKEKLEHAKALLAERIVTVYKQGEPTMLEVVLSSDGFAQMVERATYLNAVAEQDHKIIVTVTTLKAGLKKDAVKLAKLEREASKLVAAVTAQRNAVRDVKVTLDGRRDKLASVVGNRKDSLASVAKSRRHDEEDLAAMQHSSSAVQGYLTGGGDFKKGSGQLSMPVSGSFTSPFGQRWGRLHAGVDIAAPTGTPIWAADTGTVRYAGWMSGYGNYTCIQHTSSMSTCYGHQSRIGVRVGQAVKQGQVIGAVGNTGNSFGAHLHFEVRIGGNPVDPMGYL